RIAAEIDRIIETRWLSEGLGPADPASDTEYLRRVHLHIGGCIPAVSETRKFLADKSPDKRSRVVDQLLDGPGYVVNFTRYWRRDSVPGHALALHAPDLV